MEKSEEELRIEMCKIQSELAAREQRKQRERMELQKLNLEQFQNKYGVHVSISDDYAYLDVGLYGTLYDAKKPALLEFYLGYEEKLCPVHGADEKACDEVNCEEGDWAFVVKESGIETMRLSHSSLQPETTSDELERSLLCGIGIWLEQKFRQDHSQFDISAMWCEQ